MDPSVDSRWWHCYLCGGATGEEQWANEFHLVFINGKSAMMGNFTLTRRVSESISQIEVTIPGLGATQRTLLTRRYCMMHLVHRSCFRLLNEISQVRLSDFQQYHRLSQSLREYPYSGLTINSHIPLGCCSDPSQDILPVSTVDIYKKFIKRPKGAVKLPPELMMLVLSHFDAKTLILFFGASCLTLGYAPLYCREHQWRFYPSIAESSTDSDIMVFMLAISRQNYSTKEYTAIDRRWRIFDRLQTLAKCIRTIPYIWTSSISNRLPSLGTVRYPITLFQLEIVVPQNIDVIDVYTTNLLPYNHYVCGLGWTSSSGNVVHGSSHGHKSTIRFENESCDNLRFTMDTLGVTGLKFERNSQWLFGDTLASNTAWEGVSFRRRSSAIKVIMDGLKFRQIKWSVPGASEFIETLIMRNYHALNIGIVSRSGYHAAMPVREAKIAADCGSIAVETIHVHNTVTRIIAYCDYLGEGIVGIHVRSSTTREQLVGRNCGFPIYFVLHSPFEFIQEVDVHVCRGRQRPRLLGITVKTNWKRQGYLGLLANSASNCSVDTLSAPYGSFINGLYFRLDCDGLYTAKDLAKTYIASCGIIWTTKPAVAARPACLPALKLPSLNSLYTGCQEMHYRMGSCARLGDVAKVLAFYLDGLCVGMEVYYHYKISEIVGRETPDYKEVTFTEDERMRRIWIVKNKKSRLVVDIYFGTDESSPGGYDGEMHLVTNDTALYWWQEGTMDLILVRNVQEVAGMEDNAPRVDTIEELENTLSNHYLNDDSCCVDSDS